MDHILPPEKLLLTYLQIYDSYHRQKETMTWIAFALFLSGAGALLGGRPFWIGWPCWAISIFVGLVLAMGIFGWWFVWWQFSKRELARRFYDACANLAARWVISGPVEGDLDPTILCEMECIQFPKALVDRFREQKKRCELPTIFTLTIMGIWGTSALLRVCLFC